MKKQRFNAMARKRWERELERRLAADLDSFLATAADDAFFFADEESESAASDAERRVARASKKNGDRVFNRRRFKRLATSATALTLLGVVAWAALVDVASPNKSENAKTSEIASVVSATGGDKASLIAWSVEKWSETDGAALWRQVEEQLVNVDILSGCDESNVAAVDGEEERGDGNGDDEAEGAFAFAFAFGADGATDGSHESGRNGGEDKKESAFGVIAWNETIYDAETSFALWTCEPLWRVAAFLR